MENRYLIICDNQQKSYFSQVAKGIDFSFVVSEAKFEALNADEIANYNRIIIFAELMWQDKKYTDFYGIEIAVKIRSDKNALSPICVLSFMPKFYFHKEEVIYNILEVRGTTFCQMPCSFKTIEDSLNSIIPLSAATLAFMPLYLDEIKNLIGEINHNLRIKSEKKQIELTLSKINHFSRYENFNDLLTIRDEILIAFGEENHEKFEYAKKKLVEKLNTQPDRKLSSGNEKVLLLEDKEDELLWAKSELEKYFEVHAYQDANEIIKKIDKDERNDYRAVICDWELLKPNSLEHQDLLGFEVLEYASQKRLYALFSLTITDDYSVRDVDAYLNFEHQIFKKEFVEEKSRALWNSYIPIIQQKVRQITELIGSIPLSRNWDNVERKKRKVNPYNIQYIKKRNSANWTVFEHGISEQANNYFDYGADESILEIGEDIESLLIPRRIFYERFLTKFFESLGYNEKRNKIFAVEFAMREFGRKNVQDGNNRSGFLNDLCLRLNDLPFGGMLPEEKAWLVKRGFEI